MNLNLHYKYGGNRHALHKFLLVMKLIVLLITTAILQVSASTYAQKITLNKTNMPLEKVMKEIRQQSGYDFFYDLKLIKNTNPVSINVKDASLEEVLDKCFVNQPLTYKIGDKVVMIKEKEKGFFENMIARFQAIDITGKIVDENSQPLIGASVKIKGTDRVTRTNEKGEFLLSNVDKNAVLVISYLGYQDKEIKVLKELGTIALSISTGKLDEVNVVSTGYQTLPKERATGSFTIVDDKTINRGVGTNILDRLEGVTSGLLLYPRNLTGNSSKVTIHGRSTLFANAAPLIVLNGFPYDGTIDQINPADIESINVLKDAAAASIWGTRSGNGVIVITTKSGRKNQKLTVGINSTLTISDKPDLYYIPQLSSVETIDLEQFLFAKGFYNSRFNNAYNPVSPAVEIFNQRKNGIITAADSASKIDALKGYDVRKDIEKYVYRNKVQQQYQVNISGGTDNHTYYLSGGFDRNLESKVSDRYDRITLNASNDYSMFKNKLSVNTDINYVSSTSKAGQTYSPFSPYERMADENGNSLPTVFRSGFRMSYVDTVGNGKLLDWHYRPKDELAPTVIAKLNQYRIKAGVDYKIIDGLIVSANYQYLAENSERPSNLKATSYLARSTVNQYSTISNGVVNRVIPIGDILGQNTGTNYSKILRTQLNFNKLVSGDHEINAILGYEASDNRTTNVTQTLYGYNSENMTSVNGTINPQFNYPFYYGGLSGMIDTTPILVGAIAINQSYYGNFSYTYKGKYIASGSARRDESNIFGVKTNQKGVPLWSAGLAWNVDKESFYSFDWLPKLKTRATFGYNGNVDRSVSAYLTARLTQLNNIYGDPTAEIQNPPNPSLRWEKVKTWNFGIDFSSKNNIITGSLDFYQKNANDLIGNLINAPQTGVSQFRGNGADLQTKGIDVLIRSDNLIGKLSWNTTVLYNYNTDKVTKYEVKQSTNLQTVSNNTTNPLEGYPYYSIFSFPTAGLDATGAPQGYLNGKISKDYTTITSVFDPSQLKFHGSASPKHYGSVINTFGFENFELSFNLTYKFGYFFRRENVFGGSSYGSALSPAYIFADYNKRWQKPGDEFTTNTPALVYPNSAVRTDFNTYSENLVEKGDHLRLQDIRLSYYLKNNSLLKFKSASIFLYARNVGILWRANKLNIDPDFRTNAIPAPFTGSVGLNLNF
ncbi:SusC/RagA family TonB-linked outer membrane protein [Pedobacter nyackensis]|uniref:TonB-linked outer membrane protein, SusC/RagA family n=1 Tax=Pedobacter nyackensis TaxID=475255 RepID=A0A1W2A2R2_9SPHI|nr:SusC/RagA family TonB-linked outer membrane protein [Pedobacter nyackensis]SMC54752.1 TonB-linked outer membrane protein, SusC/RagA family [Pedobacter nyackensis]